MVSVLFHTTLIRDQNGLGFSIAGGEGSPPFKDNNDVNISKINHILLSIIFLYRFDYQKLITY